MRKTIYDIYINKIKDVLKNKGANDLLKAFGKKNNNLLHKAFLRWWRNTMKIDPNRTTKEK